MAEWLSALITSFPVCSVKESLSEWSEANRELPAGLTARPGRYDFDLTPFSREIADCLSVSDPTTEIVYMKSTQVGSTVGIIENYIGYCIAYGIGPLLYISGDQQLAEDTMSTKVDELIKSAGLQDKIKPLAIKRNNKASGDRRDLKTYSGTFIRAIGPNSESKARSFPARGNLFDEVDVYPQIIMRNGSKTGNPIQKVLRRADSFGAEKKNYFTSTPKEIETSQIYPRYLQGTMEEYRFECPSCGTSQKLKFENLKWDKNKDGKLLIEYKEIDGNQIPVNDPVYYECDNKKCKRKIKEHEKYDLLKEKHRGGTGKWFPTKKPDRPGLRSFHINALASYFRTWLDIVIQWEEVKDDPVLLPDFINDVLGEPSRVLAEKPDIHELMAYAENWAIGDINKDVILLTLAVDVQKDRLEAGLMGWGRERQGWFINRWVFKGNPKNIEDKSWKHIEEIISNEYMKEGGELLNISITFIDQQYLTDSVTAFVDSFDYDKNSVNGVYPVLARETLQGSGLVKKIQSDINTPIIALNDQALKKLIYQILKKKPFDDGTFPHSYFHFSEEYNKNFFDQLTSEEYVVRKDQYNREKTLVLNTKNKRNEVLDIAKMNFAALIYAVNEFFEIQNKNRRARGLKEKKQDLDDFFDFLDGVK